ncbi:hypothetical protein K435DRAFT_563346, partial [Dendrothele bispora CBS 962.96]
VKAFTLFNTGSTADIISPDFANIVNVKMFQLSNPLILQLGTKGSRSCINYGCKVDFRLGEDDNQLLGKMYFDIANINRYDMVIGCCFMWKYGISVDLQRDSI